MHEQLLGVDWGTTNRRAYLVNREGARLRFHEDAQGMLAARGRFAQALDELRSVMGVAASVPVVMSGMVGSAQGWMEVPYLGSDVALDALPRHLAALPEGGARFIVPGYRTAQGDIDVMRGEETQLLGALALGQGNGWVVMPGTHSKWVVVEQGRMLRWSTYMTGELFATLGREGTLSALLQADGAEEQADFDAGLALARRRLPLTNSLFSVRARVVSGAMRAGQARAFTSGLLIGTEFVAAADSGVSCDAVTFIGSSGLVQRYARSAEQFGMAVKVVDPHAAYCAAMARILKEGNLDAA